MTQKSKSARQRAEAKRAKRKRQQQMTIAGVIGVVLVVGLVLVFMRPGAAADIPQERLEHDPMIGSPDASVTIVEYGSYSCISCRNLYNTSILEKVIEDYDGQVNLVFRDFPVITPAYDHMSAEVAQCVLDQSEAAFWQFHDLLYSEYFTNLSRDEMVTLASEQLPIDADALQTCAEARTHYNTVEFDLQRGQKLGIRGIPALFVDDKPIYSASESALHAAIDAALNG